MPSTTSEPIWKTSPAARSTPGTRGGTRDHARGDRRRSSEGARERGARRDVRVDARVRGLLDVVERRPDLIGLDVRAGDHRDAEEDRDGGQRGAQLALPMLRSAMRDHADRRPQAVEDRVDRRALLRADDASVGEEDDAVGEGRGATGRGSP